MATHIRKRVVISGYYNQDKFRLREVIQREEPPPTGPFERELPSPGGSEAHIKIFCREAAGGLGKTRVGVPAETQPDEGLQCHN